MKEAMEQFMANSQPIPRTGHPEDIAGMVLYLASDDAEWVTGQAMVVDGGLTIGANFGSQGGIPQGQSPIPLTGFMGPSFEG
jgi:enoyl-[acyl-carrier-protein] reductase (NADH)